MLLRKPSPRLPIIPREEKTEQLADTWYEVDLLMLELQDAHRDVSGKPILWGRLGS